MPIPLILDTDIGGDSDDALALAFALRHPDIELRAVTTVSGDTRTRAQIAAKLLRLAGRADIEVAAGDDSDFRHGSRSAWSGNEGEGFLEPGDSFPTSERDAVRVLIEETARDGRTQIATIGAQTNLAGAVERDPSLTQRVALLAVMGGVFQPLRFLDTTLDPSADFNLNVDPSGSLQALNAGFRTLYVPCDVTFGAWLERRHLDQLRKGDAFCRALADLIEVWEKYLRRRSGSRMPADYVGLLHDPLTVACMVDRRFVTTTTLPVTVALQRAHVRTFVDPAAGAEAEVITSVDAPAFADFWLETVIR